MKGAGPLYDSFSEAVDLSLNRVGIFTLSRFSAVCRT